MIIIMINFNEIILEDGWMQAIYSEFSHEYMRQLQQFINHESKTKTIYPPKPLIFNALKLTAFDDVRVVILGQDPYHGQNQAHGLCFSVPKGVAIPPSLRNIYKELNRDLNIHIAEHGCLESWAKQGVLLLNSVLTVEDGLAASHQGRGWERFTDVIIQKLNNQNNPICFVLWGNYAQKKGEFIDDNKHLVLKSAHPSPLSASRGFIGNGHFSKINAWLLEQKKAPIDWRLFCE